MHFSRHSSFALLLSLCACATGTELGNSSGGTGSLTSSSGGSSSSNSSSSSSSSGEAGGSGGSGGMSNGGMGGAGGGASSSSSSSSSSSTGSGMGGSGGVGGVGGMGGMGGAAPTGTLVAIAGPSAGGAYFEPATGWTSAPLNFTMASGDIAPRMAGGALAVMRRSSGIMAENNELFWTTWTKASGFAAPQQVGTFGFAVDGPATAPAGASAVMTFLGTDNKHYYAQNDNGNSFGAFGPIPAGMVQMQAFGPSATVLASDGAAGVYTLYAGGDAQLYYAYKASAGGAWGPSTQVPTSTVVNTVRPFAFVDAALDLRIFYIRKSDDRICMVKLVTPQNSWTTEETIASATTSKQLSAAEIGPGGDIIVAYHGLITEGIYFVRGKDGAFANITTVEVPAGTSSAPVVTRGLSGADAEILYAAGGKLRHARVNGNAATPSDVLNLNGVTSVVATMVP